MNILIISGNVGREPELRQTQSGDKVLGFSFANKTGFGDRAETQWYDVSIWGKRGESLYGKIKKGDKLILSGESKLVEFQKKDGSTDKKNTLRVNELEFAGGGDNADRSQGASSGSRGRPGGYDGDRPLDRDAGNRGGNSRSATKPAFDPDLDDSIPF